MTIDEKIQDFRQLEYDFEHSMCDTEDDKENLMKYQQEYEYYKQLAEWLEELKRRREYDGEIIGSGALKNAYNKAIDDFKSRLEERILSGKMIDEKFAYIDNSDIDEIAEQLKAGGTDE